MTKRKEPRSIDPPYALVTYPIDGTVLVESAQFARDLEDARNRLREAGENPDSLAAAALCWNEARQKELNRRKAAGGAIRTETTKRVIAETHGEIATKLAEGETVKQVALDRQLAGRKGSVSERTVARIKKAKGL